MSEINVSSAESTTPAAATPAAPAAPSAIPQAPAAPVTATPQIGSQAAATPAAPTVEPSWLRGRLEETRAAAARQVAEAYQRREAQYAHQLQQMQQQLHALVGVAPQGNPELDNIRQQFGQVYPGLSQLEQRAQDVMSLLERQQELQAANDHIWQQHGRTTMNRIFDRVQENLGAPVTEAGKRQLHSMFLGYVQSSPELVQRYTSDPTLVDEFVDNFTSSFIQPSRRLAAAAPEMRGQSPLPGNAPSGAPQLSQVPQPSGLDQRAAAGWAALQHARNQG